MIHYRTLDGTLIDPFALPADLLGVASDVWVEGCKARTDGRIPHASRNVDAAGAAQRLLVDFALRRAGGRISIEAPSGDLLLRLVRDLALRLALCPKNGTGTGIDPKDLFKRQILEATGVCIGKESARALGLDRSTSSQWQQRVLKGTTRVLSFIEDVVERTGARLTLTYPPANIPSLGSGEDILVPWGWHDMSFRSARLLLSLYRVRWIQSWTARFGDEMLDAFDIEPRMAVNVELNMATTSTVLPWFRLPALKVTSGAAFLNAPVIIPIIGEFLNNPIVRLAYELGLFESAGAVLFPVSMPPVSTSHSPIPILDPESTSDSPLSNFRFRSFPAPLKSYENWLAEGQIPRLEGTPAQVVSDVRELSEAIRRRWPFAAWLTTGGLATEPSTDLWNRLAKAVAHTCAFRERHASRWTELKERK